ncbi:MAG: SIMPL domain-containing protein [Lentisphaeria bacterium]|nr:SIMPL domain-containing protein [Lentisphaeria bacterium]
MIDAKKVSLLVLCSVLVLTGGVVASAALLSRFAVKIHQSSATVSSIRVKGIAEKEIVSDIGAFSCTITCNAADIASGYAEINRLQTLLTAKFRELGIKADWVENETMSFFPVTKTVRTRENNREVSRTEFSHYQFSRNCRVRSSEVRVLENASVGLYSLAAGGVNISVSNVEYFISDLEQYKLGLVDAASASAYQRANVVARKCGSRLGKLLTARQGVIQITKPASDDTRDGGVYDTSTINKVMRLVVTMDFALE